MTSSLTPADVLDELDSGLIAIQSAVREARRQLDNGGDAIFVHARRIEAKGAEIQSFGRLLCCMAFDQITERQA